MNKRYSRQEIKDFFDSMYKPSSDGCYNIHLPTWQSMMKQDPSYWLQLEIERTVTKINKIKHPEPPIGVRYVKDGIPSHERKPFDYKLLILIGVYLCGVVSGLIL